MASLTDYLERRVYRGIFEEGYADAEILDTGAAELFLYNTTPTGDDGIGGTIFDTFIGSLNVIEGYAPVDLFDGVNLFEVSGGTETGIFSNAVEINFGTNARPDTGDWLSSAGWGIRTGAHPSQVALQGQWLDSSGDPTTFEISIGQSFIIPIGAFLINVQ